jgi:hypothetical protein
MRTRIKSAIRTIICTALAAVLLFSTTTGVYAASNWKTVTLNSSCTEGITYTSYKTKTTMELSPDGNSLTCTYSPYKANGTLKKSIDLKSALPADVLAEFKDGEVYLYAYVFYEGASCTNKSSQASVKRHLKEDGITNYVRLHYDWYTKEESKHKAKNCEGTYYYCIKTLLSNVKGTGTVTLDRTTNNYRYLDGYYGKDDYSVLEVVGSLFLADKDGNKITDITFQEYEYETEGVTCSLTSLENDTNDNSEEEYGIIVVTSGTTLSEKLVLTGGDMAGKDYSKVKYVSSLLTVKKDGTVTTKKGKYGIAEIKVVDSDGTRVTDSNGETMLWTVYITDGSKKMLNTLKKQHSLCTLTVGKNGKYTIKKFN